ncbi:hypothetical protein GPROT2_00405 [Gammaproteobacteria bacterium]|nr:hypothetical protein GPROT2_00405 [Gammaproteobacteria bacterium]
MKTAYIACPLLLVLGAALATPAMSANPPAAQASAAQKAAADATVIPLMVKELADFPGKEVEMLTVEYAPGASSGSHRHNAHTFVYVLEGSVVMQVEGGKVTTLGPGGTFYESPHDVHTVSRNASSTSPARFLVLFLKDKGAPGTVPVH